jgi:hypothetical protein
MSSISCKTGTRPIASPLPLVRSMRRLKLYGVTLKVLSLSLPRINVSTILMDGQNLCDSTLTISTKIISFPLCLTIKERLIMDVTVRFSVMLVPSSFDNNLMSSVDWSNFEIADMDFWRSQTYTDYFNYLDSMGGFYYEVSHHLEYIDC